VIDSKDITFTQHGDGRVTVDRFPAEIETADEFLARASPSLCRVDGDRLILTLANGSAVYVLVRTDGLRPVSQWARLYADQLVGA
jgi:hypothetical protein